MPLSPSVPDIIPIPGATGQFMSPDTTKTTRTDFTDFFLRFQHAPDAHPHYKHLFTVHQEIARLLIKHPAMERNLQQTFSTPANSKNKVYFMWDFILRTFQNIAALVDPRRPYGSPPWSDVLLRAAMASGLMLDTTGQLEEGNASVGYHDDAGIELGTRPRIWRRNWSISRRLVFVVLRKRKMAEGCGSVRSVRSSSIVLPSVRRIIGRVIRNLAVNKNERSQLKVAILLRSALPTLVGWFRG
jgi:hypothetical protein